VLAAGAEAVGERAVHAASEQTSAPVAEERLMLETIVGSARVCPL
jgi:hypothetical protein